MPLQFETIELPVTGLSQKHDERQLPAGRLSVCKNMEFDKIGKLNKRKGYQNVTLASTSSIHTPDALWCEIGIHADELVLLGYHFVWSLANVDAEAHATGSIVKRGPNLRGNIRRQDVAAGAVSNENFVLE